ncbi:hypothetical protein BN1723_017322, partial [Verticillium longisporum]
MAIRSALDVYGENVRVVCPIDSLKHGRVMVICVGAMMVGSTVITRNEGDEVKRAEELGYFKFGGSTIPVLWITCQAAPMVTGFISYGLLWATGPVLPWKLLHIVTGGLTLLLAVWVWIDYPSNPAEARWLTLEEKVQVIRRVHAAQQSSIEQKRFKRE